MFTNFLTLLFFPEWSEGLPGDLYLVHLFFFLIFIPFALIYLAARTHDKDNPNEASKGYKNENEGFYFGYEYRR
tara:strand:- start:43 stop:264 length:222 start_codon:yes stop_codon:yes gene_type:complete